MQKEQTVVLPAFVDRDQLARPHMGGARAELGALGDEGGEPLPHADQDFLGLLTLGDLEGVAGHALDQLAKDRGALHLVEPEHIRVLLLHEFHHPAHAGRIVLEVLHIPGRHREELGHEQLPCPVSGLAQLGRPARNRQALDPSGLMHKAVNNS